MEQAISLFRRILAALLAATCLAACSAGPKAAPPQASSAVTASGTSGADSIPTEDTRPVNKGSGNVTVLAGSMVPGRTDGDALEAQFIKPYGLCASSDGGLILADSYGNQLRKIDGNLVTTLAGASDTPDGGGFPPGGYLNGASDTALLNRPRFADATADGAVVFSDSENHMLRAYANGQVYALAGAPESGYRDGTFKDARFNLPSGVAVSSDGSVYVADTLNHAIRVLSPDGQVRTLAGESNQPGFQDGSLDEALFCEPNDIAFGPDGALYVVDKGNQRIRRIYGGQVSTVAGSGNLRDKTTGYIIGGYLDGAAAKAQFLYPTGITVSDSGVVYIADTGNNCIRALTPDGMVTTAAGSHLSGNRAGHPEDARFNQPLDVLYRDGILYVSDSYNHVIKSVELDENQLGTNERRMPNEA